MTKWKYGNAWEHFPMEEGEVWSVGKLNSKVAVHNIFNDLPSFMNDADMLFIDPPWNKGNVNSFYTKAGRNDHIEDFSIFEEVLFQRLREISPNICYLEVGFQAVDKWCGLLSELYQTVQRWEVTYYKRNKCFILRGCNDNALDFNYTGMDEEKVYYKSAEIENCLTIGDFCMGLGLAGLAASKANKRFVGVELNKRRLANLLQKLHKKGEQIERI